MPSSSIRLALALAVMLTFAAPALASDLVDDGHAPDERLLQAHFLCDEASRSTPLDRGLVVFCSKVFQAIKLGFLPGVTPDTYAAMTPREQALANRAGYVAWRNWIERNPKRVGQLRLQAYARRGGSSA